MIESKKDLGDIFCKKNLSGGVGKYFLTRKLIQIGVSPFLTLRNTGKKYKVALEEKR